MNLSYWVFFFFLLISCQPNSSSPQTTVFSGIAMTIPYRITIGTALNEEEIHQINALIATTFKEINTRYNKYNPSSELSSLNQLKENETKSLSPELLSMFRFINHLVLLTQRRFDPTVESLQSLWKQKLKKGTIPSAQEIASLQNSLGWQNIHFHDGFFWKDDATIQIDLGGIAKGYAVDLLARRIVDKGYKNVLVDWGGEFFASGIHPENRPWKVSIFNPDRDEIVVPLQNQALATSGNYLQYWVVDTSQGQEVYSHILDPHTGKLMNSQYPIMSASVVAPTCALADGLATAAMLCQSEEDMREWAKSIEETLPDVYFWFILKKLPSGDD